MATKNILKESFDIESKNGAFFTGGKIKWSEDGATLFCQNSGVVNLIDLELGSVKLTLGDTSDSSDVDIIHCFTIKPDGTSAVTSHKSGLLKLWNCLDGSLSKHWKNIHKGPVADLDLRSDGLQLATGGSDSIVRVWDLLHHACTHGLRGATGVVSVVKFHENTLYGSGDDLKITCWDLESHDVVFQLSGHFSKVTALSFHHDGRHLVSSGRDKVLMLWDIESRREVKTVPVYEALEGVICLPNKFEVPTVGEITGGVHVATAGEKGVIRVFEMKSAKEVFAQQNSLVAKATEEGGLSVTQLLWNHNRNSFAVATADHNILLHRIDTFQCVKQLVGFTDEILDVVFLGPRHSHVAIATNSADIKVYNAANWDCQLLRGHTDIVICLAASRADDSLLLSASKDNTVKLWKLDQATQQLSLLCTGSRHTASVSSVCFPSLGVTPLLSAGQDLTLKTWDLSLTVRHTVLAHEKEINCVTVSPNDKLAATASQDKTLKLWTLPDLSPVGTLRGHRRGVWSTRFSPVDQVLLSASADATVKLWSVAELSCLKTFEGHESSVLRAEFVSRGMQVLTAAGDGVLRLWNVSSGERSASFEGHDGKIWAMAISNSEDKILTGGSDSTLVTWRDSTVEKRDTARRDRDAIVEQEQKLANLLNNNQLLAALMLALSLDRPYQVLKITKEIIEKNEPDGLRSTISKLSNDEKEKLLKIAASWNSNSKNSDAAQVIISILLDELASGELRPSNLSSYIEDLLPYTERHFKRLTGILQDLHFLQYTIAAMNPAFK